MTTIQLLEQLKARMEHCNDPDTKALFTACYYRIAYTDYNDLDVTTTPPSVSWASVPRCAIFDRRAGATVRCTLQSGHAGAHIL